jgi:hypothetical protein
LNCLTILTKTITFPSVSLVLGHHTGIPDILWLAGGDSLTSPNSVEEEQDDDLDTDTGELCREDAEDTSNTGNVVWCVFGIEKEWTCP